MLLELDVIYPVLNSYSEIDRSTIEIINGNVNIYVSNKNTKPSSISEMTLTETNITGIYTVIGRPRFIAVDGISGTPLVYDNNVVMAINY